MLKIMDPITMRWIERLLIVAGGILFGHLGYRLFIFGVKEGAAKVTAQSKIAKIMFSGTAPGLFFMACGCGILVGALFLQMKTWQRQDAYRNLQASTVEPSGGTNHHYGIKYHWIYVDPNIAWTTDQNRLEDLTLDTRSNRQPIRIDPAIVGPWSLDALSETNFLWNQVICYNIVHRF